MVIDRDKLAVIHIVKKELGLSEEDYRAVLKNVAGVSSAKELDAEGFRNLMNYLVRDKRYRIEPGGMTLKQKLFIQNLASQLNWHEDHLKNFIHKYYHKPRLEELTRGEASKLIQSLKNIQAGSADT